MSLVRRLFSSSYRQARRAEAEGRFRDAAALYAEADLPEDAAKAFLFHAARATDLDERVLAYRDALRWLPEEHPKHREVDAQIGLALLDAAQHRAAHTAEERRRLEEAAERLERAGKPERAATAWELLGRPEDMARCLQAAGDIERLETLLDARSAEASRERTLRRRVGDYEMALATGARLEAREALRQAVREVPDDADVAELLQRLEARWLAPGALTLRIDGERLRFVGGPALVVGREGDLPVRGASVSRRHCVLRREGDALVVEDLGSRNGTLLRGVPIDGSLRVSGATEIGLGDDVALRVDFAGAGLRAEVTRGLDRGLEVRAGAGELPLGAAEATLGFPGGHPTLTPGPGGALLGTQRVNAPIALLRGDVIDVGPVRLEVPS
ncbi:MAG: FHA domain-containing protein [Myxococcota bacterium]